MRILRSQRHTWVPASYPLMILAGALLAIVAAKGLSQAPREPLTAATKVSGKCECGAHPPAPPRDREVEPYAGEPSDLSPFAKFAAPYDRNYTHPNVY